MNNNKEFEELLRKARLKKDGYKCQLCGRDTYIQVHHKKYPPESIEDLQTVCVYCHREIHNKHLNKKYSINGHLYEDRKQLVFKKIVGPKYIQITFDEFLKENS